METVTTQDLLVDAVRYNDIAAQNELDRRGVNWRQYNKFLYV